jgi:hypothetical protein
MLARHANRGRQRSRSYDASTVSSTTRTRYTTAATTPLPSRRASSSSPFRGVRDFGDYDAATSTPTSHGLTPDRRGGAALATPPRSIAVDGPARRVKCFVRVRPFNSADMIAADGSRTEFPVTALSQGLDGRSLRVTAEQPMAFDGVFAPAAPLEDILGSVVAPAVSDSLKGLHTAVLLYGQTGSGKTFTNNQMLPAYMAMLLHFAAEEMDKYDTRITMECCQLYLESLYDLLDPSRGELQLREFPDTGVFVRGLSEIEIRSMRDFETIVDAVESNRAIAATRLNQASSRSHCLYTINITRRRRVRRTDFSFDGSRGNAHPNASTSSGEAAAAGRPTNTGGEEHDDDDDTSTMAMMLRGRATFVDLAGSERLKKSGSEGLRQVEAQYINQSLSTLGNVMHALTDPRATHVPYRDSKLTRLLQDALGGRGVASVVVTVSPSTNHVSETRQALAFGMRAMEILSTATAWKLIDGQTRLIEAQEFLENRAHWLEVRVKQLEAERESWESELHAFGNPDMRSVACSAASNTNNVSRECLRCRDAQLDLVESRAAHAAATRQLQTELRACSDEMKRLVLQVDSLQNDVEYYRARAASLEGRAPSGGASANDEAALDSNVDALRHSYEGLLDAARTATDAALQERDEACDELYSVARQLTVLRAEVASSATAKQAQAAASHTSIGVGPGPASEPPKPLRPSTTTAASSTMTDRPLQAAKCTDTPPPSLRSRGTDADTYLLPTPAIAPVQPALRHASWTQTTASAIPTRSAGTAASPDIANAATTTLVPWNSAAQGYGIFLTWLDAAQSLYDRVASEKARLAISTTIQSAQHQQRVTMSTLSQSQQHDLNDKRCRAESLSALMTGLQRWVVAAVDTVMLRFASAENLRFDATERVQAIRARTYALASQQQIEALQEASDLQANLTSRFGRLVGARLSVFTRCTGLAQTVFDGEAGLSSAITSLGANECISRSAISASQETSRLQLQSSCAAASLRFVTEALGRSATAARSEQARSRQLESSVHAALNSDAVQRALLHALQDKSTAWFQHANSVQHQHGLACMTTLFAAVGMQRTIAATMYHETETRASICHRAQSERAALLVTFTDTFARMAVFLEQRADGLAADVRTRGFRSANMSELAHLCDAESAARAHVCLLFAAERQQSTAHWAKDVLHTAGVRQQTVESAYRSDCAARVRSTQQALSMCLTDCEYRARLQLMAEERTARQQLVVFFARLGDAIHAESVSTVEVREKDQRFALALKRDDEMLHLSRQFTADIRLADNVAWTKEYFNKHARQVHQSAASSVALSALLLEESSERSRLQNDAISSSMHACRALMTSLRGVDRKGELLAVENAATAHIARNAQHESAYWRTKSDLPLLFAEAAMSQQLVVANETASRRRIENDCDAGVVHLVTALTLIERANGALDTRRSAVAHSQNRRNAALQLHEASARHDVLLDESRAVATLHTVAWSAMVESWQTATLRGDASRRQLEFSRSRNAALAGEVTLLSAANELMSSEASGRLQLQGLWSATSPLAEIVRALRAAASAEAASLHRALAASSTTNLGLEERCSRFGVLMAAVTVHSANTSAHLAAVNRASGMANKRLEITFQEAATRAALLSTELVTWKRFLLSAITALRQQLVPDQPPATVATGSQTATAVLLHQATQATAAAPTTESIGSMTDAHAKRSMDRGTAPEGPTTRDQSVDVRVHARASATQSDPTTDAVAVNEMRTVLSHCRHTTSDLLAAQRESFDALVDVCATNLTHAVERRADLTPAARGVASRDAVTQTVEPTRAASASGSVGTMCSPRVTHCGAQATAASASVSCHAAVTSRTAATQADLRTNGDLRVIADTSIGLAENATLRGLHGIDHASTKVHMLLECLRDVRGNTAREVHAAVPTHEQVPAPGVASGPATTPLRSAQMPTPQRPVHGVDEGVKRVEALQRLWRMQVPERSGVGHVEFSPQRSPTLEVQPRPRARSDAGTYRVRCDVADEATLPPPDAVEVHLDVPLRTAGGAGNARPDAVAMPPTTITTTATGGSLLHTSSTVLSNVESVAPLVALPRTPPVVTVRPRLRPLDISVIDGASDAESSDDGRPGVCVAVQTTPNPTESPDAPKHTFTGTTRDMGTAFEEPAPPLPRAPAEVAMPSHEECCRLDFRDLEPLRSFDISVLDDDLVPPPSAITEQRLYQLDRLLGPSVGSAGITPTRDSYRHDPTPVRRSTAVEQSTRPHTVSRSRPYMLHGTRLDLDRDLVGCTPGARAAHFGGPPPHITLTPGWSHDASLASANRTTSGAHSGGRRYVLHAPPNSAGSISRRAASATPAKRRTPLRASDRSRGAFVEL